MKPSIFNAALTASLLIGSVARAEDKFEKVYTPPPAALVDGKIDVTLKDGTEQHYSENTHKVVPRTQIRKVQETLDDLRRKIADLEAQLAAEKAKAPVVKEVSKEVVKEVAPPDKPNLFYAGLGAGPDGVGVNETAEGQDVSPRTAALIDIGYMHKLGDYSPWHLGVEGVMGVSQQSRSYSGFVNLGYSW